MEKNSNLDKSVQLRPHQEEAINKFIHNGNRQIFAHSLGSGKTITSLGAIERSGAKRPLILTPAALQKNYADSINKFVDQPSRSKYKVMSYEKFRMNPDKFMADYKPDALVVDEYHRQKDPSGKSFKSLLSARKHVDKFIGLTGTVMQNHPSELFPLLSLSQGSSKHRGMFDKKTFDKNFTETKKVYPSGIFKNIISRLLGRHGERKVLKNQDKLHKIFTKDVHKNMPSKEFMSNFPSTEYVDIKVPMTKPQAKVYDYFMTKDLNMIDRWLIRNNLPPKMRDSQSFFSKLTRARQAANSPIPFADKKYNIHSSGKLDLATKNLMKHLKSDPRNKAVVYSNFIDSSLKPLGAHLKHLGIDYGEFSGQLPKKLKNQNITDYNSNKKRVLLVSPSGAEGLDLKGTTLLQNLDPHWNPAKMNQVFGRAVRFKSHEALPPEKRKVRIEKYISTKKPGFFGRLFGKKPKNTIDDYIYNRAREKADLVKQVEDLL